MLLALSVCRFQSPLDADVLASVFVRGLQFDLVLLGLTLTIPILSYPLLASNRILVPAWRGLLRFCLPSVLFAIVIIECATAPFIDMFDSGPSPYLLQYLNQPGEIATAI